MSTPAAEPPADTTAGARSTTAAVNDAPVTDARAVAEEVRARLDGGHQDPEDVRAAAHMRWPEHPLTIDETVEAALHGRAAVVVHEEESSGQDALADPALHGLEADDEGLIDGREQD